MKPTSSLLLYIFTLALLFIQGIYCCFAQNNIGELQVEYSTRPLGIDVVTPRFSWQMKAEDNRRGEYQTAYQIKVTDEKGELVWDTNKIESDISLAVTYAGKQLQPTTRYSWELTVWDEEGKSNSAISWFETGLLDEDPKSSRWNNAQWIGGGEEDMVLYSHYLSVFKMEYALRLDSSSKSTKASFVFGANDRRLMDMDKNILGVEAKKGQSYIRFELDVSRVDGKGDGLAKFNVYRVGYAPNDSAEKPYRSYDIPLNLIDEANKYDKHTFNSECNFGLFEVYLDGEGKGHKISGDDDKSPSPFAPKGFNLNPVGVGNNFISFPMLADIGFYAGTGQKAEFSEVRIKNFRSPSNTLFSEGLKSDKAYNGIYKRAAQENSNFSISEGIFHIVGKDNGTLVLADPSLNAAPILRTDFRTEKKKITKARLYVTARGIYEMYINGNRVGNDYFNPGLTQYNKTQMYQTYDVTEQVMEGSANAIGAWLSEGWWSGNITYSGENWNYFGDRQSLLAQLVVMYEDGSEQVIVTNGTDWKLNTDGPIRYGSFFQGEVYDATKENRIKGWNMPYFDDGQWKPAVETALEGTTFQNDKFNYDDQKLIGQIGENASIVKTITAKSVSEVRPGVFIYDMGQNMVGFPEINVPVQTGDTITLRYAEVTYPDLPEYQKNKGMIMLENIRAALAQDIYIGKGGTETIRPRFTFHGYRFLEITGIGKALPLENVKGEVVSSIKHLTSHYETSNELVNKLLKNITWSLRGNFLSIPTDTPARNERMGWSGDINVFSKASTYLANVEPFLDRHLLAMRDVQCEDGRFTDVAPLGGGFGGTLWGSAGIVIPWEVYQQYGDLELLRKHYDAMKRYVEFLNSKIDPMTGILNEGPLGDWLSPEGYKNDDTMFWTTYHLYDLEILAKTARLLGKTEDAANFEKQYQKRKVFLNNTYIDKTSGKTLHLGNQAMRFGPPIPKERQKKKGDFVDTQASYAIPLNFNVLDENNKLPAIEHLVSAIERKNEDELGAVRPEYSLMTGFIGTASISQALSENGRNEVAYRLLQQTSYPSWLYSVKNGATTIWERLNSYTVEDGFGGNNSMNSFNHYSFGAVAAWMYNYSLGIRRDPERPGFKHFVLEPNPDPDRKMTWAKGYYDSMYGRIKSEWKWMEDGWTFNTTIPANTTATLRLKANSDKNITVDGKKLGKVRFLKPISVDNGQVVIELGSGHYDFKIEVKK